MPALSAVALSRTSPAEGLPLWAQELDLERGRNLESAYQFELHSLSHPASRRPSPSDCFAFLRNMRIRVDFVKTQAIRHQPALPAAVQVPRRPRLRVREAGRHRSTTIQRAIGPG